MAIKKSHPAVPITLGRWLKALFQRRSQWRLANRSGLGLGRGDAAVFHFYTDPRDDLHGPESIRVAGSKLGLDGNVPTNLGRTDTGWNATPIRQSAGHGRRFFARREPHCLRRGFGHLSQTNLNGTEERKLLTISDPAGFSRFAPDGSALRFTPMDY